jgi:hypothetical protein|tara:strand:+ start:3247 stop:3570 length:324 start_codon:yes stop_codon:yes gene_type:complete
MGMGGKGSMPAMPAPMTVAPPREADYLGVKEPLPEIPEITQAKLDLEKRNKLRRLASTDTRESTIANIGGGLGEATEEDEEILKRRLFVKPKNVGKDPSKGLLSEDA